MEKDATNEQTADSNKTNYLDEKLAEAEELQESRKSGVSYDMFLKYKRFIEWSSENGVIGPKVCYPATFPNGLIGMKCLSPIEYREAYLFIPYKLLMTMDNAKRVPELLYLIQNYEIFHEKKGKEPEQCILTLFMLWEYQKGEQSFWWPYLDLLPTFDKFIWELDKNLYIKQSQCVLFYDYAREFQQDGNEIFKDFRYVIEQNTPKIFKPNFFNR